MPDWGTEYMLAEYMLRAIKRWPLRQVLLYIQFWTVLQHEILLAKFSRGTCQYQHWKESLFSLKWKGSLGEYDKHKAMSIIFSLCRSFLFVVCKHSCLLTEIILLCKGYNRKLNIWEWILGLRKSVWLPGSISRKILEEHAIHWCHPPLEL